MEEQLARGPMDLPFLMLVVLLTGIGVIMVFSASYATAYYEGRDPTFYFFRQGLFAVAGLAIMYVVSKINYQTFRWLSVFALIVAILLLIAVLIPGIHTDRSDNVKRWIAVPGLGTFQPSEIAKVAVVIYFADSISKKKDKMRSFRYGILPYALILVVLGGLVLLEHHLSGALLIFGVGAAMMLVGGINWAWVGGAIGAAGVMMYLVLFVIGYNTSRIEMWHNPWLDPQGAGYQLRQSLITIGSGGLWGVGLGKSRQKFLYIPEPENDFIFSIVVEELGFIGAAIVLILFALLIMRGYWLALHARDKFGTLTIVGIITLLAAENIHRYIRCIRILF